MPSIADLITQQYQRTGAPGLSTTTTTQPDQGEGLDILSLLMMMLYSGVFSGKPGTTETLGTTAVPPMNDISGLLGTMPPLK